MLETIIVVVAVVCMLIDVLDTRSSDGGSEQHWR